MTTQTRREQLKDSSEIISFDDSPTIRMAQEFGKSLDAEIKAAGGIDAWRTKMLNERQQQKAA